MRIIDTTDKIREIAKGCVLTIGNFDGVHIGHQQIIKTAKKIADQRKIEFVLMTFCPHPLAVLYPDKAPGILTDVQLKNRLIASLGVDVYFILEVTPEILSLTAQEFIARFLIDSIQPSVVVEGDDFNFGAGRLGGIETLKTAGAEQGFEVVVIDSQDITLSNNQSVRVSSTMIRYMLANGHVRDAAVALGRWYRLVGKVVQGRGKGKQLGFPTVNMQLPNQTIPAEGVYAGRVLIAETAEDILAAEENIDAAISIGRAETIAEDNPLAVEAHLLAENIGNLSDKWIAIDFVKYIRPQQKFQTEAQLTNQIKSDCKNVKGILDEEN